MLQFPIHIIGSGGIGVALAWSLTRAGCTVSVVESQPAKLALGQRDGLSVVGQKTLKLPFIAFDDWTPPSEGYVLLCTKTYDNAAVLERLPNRAVLIPVQNGFDPELERLEHHGEGIASFVSECERERPVTRITRPGCLHLGGRRELTDAERAPLQLLAKALEQGGLFPVHFVENIRPFKATKLMYNAAISPLAASAGVDNGELLTDALAKQLFLAMLRENYGILRHAGIPMAKIGPFHPDTVSRILRTPGLPALLAVFFRPSLRGTYCSMAPDIQTGRTEIEAYNGQLIRLARDFPCPLNRAALGLVNQLVEEQLVPDRKHLRQMADSLTKGVLK